MPRTDLEREKRRKYYQDNKEKINGYRRKYRLKNKEKIEIRRAKYYQDNKEELRAKGRKYYQDNKEKIIERKRIYRQENPEKISATGKRYRQKHQVESNRYQIFMRDDFRCIYCGKSSFADGKELHADHVIPKSRGGLDTFGNMVTACIECNLSKSKQPLKESILLEILQIVAKRNDDCGIDKNKPLKNGS